MVLLLDQGRIMDGDLTVTVQIKLINKYAPLFIKLRTSTIAEHRFQLQMCSTVSVQNVGADQRLKRAFYRW